MLISYSMRYRFLCRLPSILAALLLVTSALFSPLVDLATVSGSPDAEVAPVEIFTGPTYIDFWWDPTELVGCDEIQIHRKISTDTSYTLIATPSCDAGLYTDSAAVAGVSYTYQFSVYGEVIPPATTPPLLYHKFINGTPGVVGGELHRTLSLGGALTITSITVAENAVLSLNSVTATNGTVTDFIAEWDGTVREHGTVVVNGGSYTDFTFSFVAPASTVNGVTLINAVVNTYAGVADSDLTSSSVGFNGTGSVSLSGCVLTGTLISLVEGVSADIGGNTWTNSSLSFWDSAGGHIYDNTFQSSRVRSLEESSLEIDGNAFNGAIPETNTMIDVTSSAGVSIANNYFVIDDVDGTGSVISISPETTPDNSATFSITGNILSGSGGGIGLQVHSDTNANIPSVSIMDNTIARFEEAISLHNWISPGGVITATVNGNTITSNNYGILANLKGSGNALTAHNNCLASNTTGAIWCGNTGNVLDATNNYWGHPSGPSHLTNPEGLGDRVWCSDAATEINFTPWLESHACYISDLAIAKMEVIQSVQTLSNTIPLVSGKETLVRVYPDIGTGFSLVNGTLTGMRDNVTLGTIQADHAIAVGTITDWDATRLDLDASLNFTLPYEWTRGTVMLRADVDLSSSSMQADIQSVHGLDTLASVCGVSATTESMTMTASFHERKPIQITYIPVTLETYTKDLPVTIEDVLDIHKRMLAMFPVGSVGYRIAPELKRFHSSETIGDMAGFYYAYLSGVTKRWDIINNPGEVADYYVTVYGTEATQYTGSWLFFGQPNGKLACGLALDGYDCLRSFGNQFGLRPLTIEKEQAAAPYDYDFPYADHMTHIMGYDFASGQDNPIQSPEHYDLMSQPSMEGAPSWISDFHYEKAYLDLAPVAPAAAVDRTSTGATGDYLYISGLIGQDDGHFYPVVHLNNSPEPDDVTSLDPASDYCLEVKNLYGTVLEEKCFDLSFLNPATGELDAMTGFTTFVTADPLVKTLRLHYQGNTVAFMAVDSPPELTLDSAGYNATYHAVEVAWLTPLDTAPYLRYHVQYSADNGNTWTTAAFDILPNQVNYYDDAFHWGLPSVQLQPSSQARVRLIASDGFNETSVTSAAFPVPDLGPRVGILSPVNNSLVESFPIMLEGYAYDVESGDRSDGMVWSSNRDGTLGSGDHVSVSNLSGGIHTLTLSADDGDGHIGTDSIQLTVDAPVNYTDVIFLPVVLR